LEYVKTLEDIQHPSVRATLGFAGIKSGLEIHHDADLPARSGLGSSSSFTVGLLNTLYALKGEMPSKKKLADEAIHIEQDLLKENVGCQDQYMAAFGGFNIIYFYGMSDIRIKPVTIRHEKIKELQGNLMLFFTGLTRFASEIAADQIKNTPQKKNELKTMLQMVDEGVSILTGRHDLSDFGKLLHEAWRYKKSITGKISNQRIDEIYRVSIESGALGGKLLGAGGGGFMLLFVPPEKQHNVREALKDLVFVPFNFDNSGSTIIFYQPDQLNGI
jgi:D-glycero-alpha-D-manno-heptose-7-phosphate kinase